MILKAGDNKVVTLFHVEPQRKRPADYKDLPPADKARYRRRVYCTVFRYEDLHISVEPTNPNAAVTLREYLDTYTGVTECSPKDHFDPEAGKKFALGKALRGMFPGGAYINVREELWQDYLKKHPPGSFVTEEDLLKAARTSEAATVAAYAKLAGFRDRRSRRNGS